MGEGRILVQATVTAVSDDHFLYPCCVQCYSKLLHDVHHSRWRCLKCGVSCLLDELEWRYRLRMTIADANEYRQVAVFGKTVQPFFGASANTFQRFLTHLQKTESDLADIVLKQAVDIVLIGHSFLFGFASATKNRPIMTVSCLSDVKDAKGSNSDLIAVQMICPDPTQLTTVSQQMTLLFKDILSNSLDQISADDTIDNSSTKLTLRKSSLGTANSYFNSILDLSENSSLNSLASILMSCENSLLKNLTATPGSVTVEACELKEDTRLEDVSFVPPCDEPTYCEDVSAFTQDIHCTEYTSSQENDFEETMNDSSLLLADKDACAQIMTERYRPDSGDRLSAGLSSPTDRNDSSSESEVMQTCGNTKQDLYQLEVKDNVWEEMPYSEDLDEFLLKAYNTNHSETVSKSCQESIEKARTSDLDTDQTAMIDHFPSMISYQGPEVDHCGDVTIPHLKSMDFTVPLKSQHGFGDAPSDVELVGTTIIDMPESENLDEFLEKAYSNLVPKTYKCITSKDNHLSPIKSSHSSESSSTSSCQRLCQAEVETNHKPNSIRVSSTDQNEETVQLKFDLIQETESQVVNENCSIIPNTETMDGSFETQEDLEIYFANSFSPENYGNSFSKSTREMYSTTSPCSAKVKTTCDPKKNKVDHENVSSEPKESFDCGEMKEVNIPSFNEDQKTTSSESNVPSVNDKLLSKGVPEDNLEIKSAPGHLFHPVASIGSLNCSTDLFDTSADLFEDCGELEETVLEDVSTFENHYLSAISKRASEDCSQLQETGTDSYALVKPQLTAVCQSVDESMRVCQLTENIPAELSESHRRKVKFARRLSHVSTVKLMDIRMKLNFGIPPEHHSTPVKSCIKKGIETEARKIVLTSVGKLDPSTSNRPTAGKPDELDEDSSEERELYALSQDLFACSQTDNSSRSPVYDPEHNDATQQDFDDKTKERASHTTDISTDSLQNNTQIIPDVRKPSADSSIRVSNSHESEDRDTKSLIDEKTASRDLSLWSYGSLCDTSLVLFSQMTDSDPCVQVSSPPAADVHCGDVMLAVTPDLFSP